MSNLNLTKLLLIILPIFLFSCAKPEVVIETTQKETDISKISETVKDIKPITKESDDKLIEKALLNHYDNQFGCNDSDLKTTGFLMYRIEDGEPGYKRAYGFANYMEYNIEDDKLTPVCGSGTTAVSISYNTNGNDYTIYEVLTDGDYQSEAFKTNFPEDIQDIILERRQTDIEKVNENQKNMVKRIYKEKMGKELTAEIFDRFDYENYNAEHDEE